MEVSFGVDASYCLAPSIDHEVSHPELTWANLKTVAVLFWRWVLMSVFLFSVVVG